MGLLPASVTIHAVCDGATLSPDFVVRADTAGPEPAVHPTPSSSRRRSLDRIEASVSRGRATRFTGRNPLSTRRKRRGSSFAVKGRFETVAGASDDKANEYARGQHESGIAGQDGFSGLMRRAYRADAALYDTRTARYQADRQGLVDVLPVRPGQTVVDVGCGTGLCFERLQAKVGRQGRVIGLDESPDMLALAAQRVADAGWRNVTLLHASAQHASLPVVADAALFCAVHDVLQSPPALANIVAQLGPRGWVAAAGGRSGRDGWSGPTFSSRRRTVRTCAASTASRRPGSISPI